MSAVSQIHPWTVHIARSDDEYIGLCGAGEASDLIVEDTNNPLPGYRICGACREEEEKRDGRATKTQR
jgi:hypothetical protein